MMFRIDNQPFFASQKKRREQTGNIIVISPRRQFEFQQQQKPCGQDQLGRYGTQTRKLKRDPFAEGCHVNEANMASMR